MKDTYFFKQHHRYTAAFSLADLGTQFFKQSVNVAPLDVGARWSGENKFERALVFSLHL